MHARGQSMCHNMNCYVNWFLMSFYCLMWFTSYFYLLADEQNKDVSVLPDYWTTTVLVQSSPQQTFALDNNPHELSGKAPPDSSDAQQRLIVSSALDRSVSRLSTLDRSVSRLSTLDRSVSRLSTLDRSVSRLSALDRSVSRLSTVSCGNSDV